MSRYGEKKNLEVTILSGDRDTFQLASDNITIRIPRTKQGKTEVDDYDRQKVLEEYGVEPKSLIEVKGSQKVSLIAVNQSDGNDKALNDLLNLFDIDIHSILEDNIGQ